MQSTYAKNYTLNTFDNSYRIIIEDDCWLGLFFYFSCHLISRREKANNDAYSSKPGYAQTCQWSLPSLFQIMLSCQVIIWTNVAVIVILAFGKIYQWNLNQHTNFLSEKNLKMSSAKCPFSLGLIVLIHLPIMSHICLSESGQHWFRQGIVAYSVPSHYLNQCWVMVYWTLLNKIQWHFSQKYNFFNHENAYEDIVCEMAVILSRRRWFKRDVGGRFVP